jgi:hypothetical protein
MQRLADRLDCNSSAIVVAGDIPLCTAHICGIHFANSAFVSPIKKALEGAGTNWVVSD